MKKLTIEEFINKAKLIHGDTYDYSKSVYRSSRNKITIVCKIHGEYKVLANSHLRGTGCKKCFHCNNNKNISKKILENKFKNLDQPSEYKLIPLTKNKFSKVDNDDFNRVKDINWCYDDNYAINGILGSLHRFILNTPDGLYTDHINNDKLDNRKSNLRVCTQSENMANVLPIKNKSSKYKGVYLNKRENKWYVQARFKNKRVFIGIFDDEIEAAKAYDKKALELFGEFAKLNFETDG